MTAYDLKEDFFGIYDDHPSSREEAEAAFEAWTRLDSGWTAAFEPFRALARTVDNHREYIFNWWDCPSLASRTATPSARTVSSRKRT